MTSPLKDSFNNQEWRGSLTYPCPMEPKTAYDQSELQIFWEIMHRDTATIPPAPTLPADKVAVIIFQGVTGFDTKVNILSVDCTEEYGLQIKYENTYTPAASRTANETSVGYVMIFAPAHSYVGFQNVTFAGKPEAREAHNKDFETRVKNAKPKP